MSSILSLRAISVLLALGLSSGLTGCSSLDSLNPFGGEKYETKLLPDIPAQDLYDQALARLNQKDYKGAAKKFEEIEQQHPYSQWSEKALLMQTYSQYEGGEYDDAIGTAQRYIALYPSSQDAPYAYYLAGMSHYNLVPDISRDQDRAQKALLFFSQLVQKYPKSEYVSDAKFKMEVMQDQLAGKEVSVGRYYLRRHLYTAAINRFHEVLRNYQKTRHVEEALYRLVEAYMAMGVQQEAQTAASILGHNFPDSPWYQDALGVLGRAQLKPEEDTSSWISKTFSKLAPRS